MVLRAMGARTFGYPFSLSLPRGVQILPAMMRAIPNSDLLISGKIQ
jgi:hypothetical protein